MHMIRPRRCVGIVLVIMLTTGCESSDDRLLQLATDSSQRQAEQNIEITHLNREIAQNHRRVVEATEESRQSMLSLEKDLQEQRGRLDAERRYLANERYRDAILAPIISTLGMVAICGLPLLLCWYLLSSLRSPRDEEISELLLCTIVDNNHDILDYTRSPPAIGQTSASDSSPSVDPPF